jgi:N-acetylglucosamine-6-phosphate deacetylase
MKGRSVFTGKPLEITVTGERISRVDEISGCNEDMPWVSPGFIDIQVNGFNGHDYSEANLNEEHITALAAELAKSGTTKHIATFVSNPHETMLNNLHMLATAREKNKDIKNAVPYIHMEGPYVSGEDGPRGAHSREYVKDPDYHEFMELQAAAGGLVKEVTLAPERKGSLAFIEKIASDGVIPAIGHTAAEPDVIRRAIAAGARISTHLGNGAASMLPRHPNYIWEQLAADELWAGVISDGFHLPPSVLKTFFRTKGPEKLILVSDCSLCGGFAPGIYKKRNSQVEVFPDGHLGVYGTNLLSGAAHLLNWDITIFMKAAGIGLAEAIGLCTKNPAEFFGLEPPRLEAGGIGDLAFFRIPQKGALEIETVLRAGKTIYSREE